jgi:predicted metal-dependent hydrolase
MNVLHLLLPEGERWFVRTFQQAVPLISDDTLREDVLGFIGQEATHAEAHSEVLDHLLARGLDPRPFTRQMEHVFRRILGPRPGLTDEQAREQLIERVAIVAAVEHFTAYLGDWMLNARALDRAGIHPVMLDLLRWHAAEEVEHRSVAYDLMRHLDRRYVRRARTMLLVAPVLFGLWVRGARFMVRADRTARVRLTWREAMRAGRRGLLPRLSEIFRAFLRYFHPAYHPKQEGSTAQAVAYLASSPAAREAH